MTDTAHAQATPRLLKTASIGGFVAGGLGRRPVEQLGVCAMDAFLTLTARERSGLTIRRPVYSVGTAARRGAAGRLAGVDGVMDTAMAYRRSDVARSVRPRRCRRLVLAGVAWLVALAPHTAGAVIIDDESRRTLDAREQGLYAATGRLDCAGTRSTAQLTVSPQVITTVAHGFYAKGGRTRGDLARCTFRIAGRSYRIDPSSIIAGSTNPYRAAGTSDWAVARLTEPVAGVAPYQIAAATAELTLVAQAHSNWRRGTKTIETCRTRSRGTEITLDCDTGQGASGAGLLVPGTRRMFGLFVGFRSTRPNRAAPFDARVHHNYGVAIRGALLAAIRRLAR